MVLFQGIDRMSHFLFGCLESPVKYPESFRLTFEQRLNCQRAVYDYYEFTDQLIGRLLKRFDNDDLVIVLSDTALRPSSTSTAPGAMRRRTRGTGCAWREDRGCGQWFGGGHEHRDITPTVLDWYGLPSASIWTGSVQPSSGRCRHRRWRASPPTTHGRWNASAKASPAAKPR